MQPDKQRQIMTMNERYLPKTDVYKASVQAEQVFDGIYRQMRLSCDLIELRRFITDFSNQRSGSSIKFPTDITLTETDKLWLNKQLLRLGLINGLIIPSEYDDILNGNVIEEVNWQGKYISYSDLVTYCRQLISLNESFGLTHGSFDPPHQDHASNFTDIYSIAGKAFVGFDPNWLLRNRKGDKRPRMPLAGRLMQVASLPTVDKVFILPVKQGDKSEFLEMYQTLKPNCMCVASDNQDISQDALRHRIPLFTASRLYGVSSTKIMEQMVNSAAITERYKLLEKIALEAGFLRDFPDQTDNQPVR